VWADGLTEVQALAFLNSGRIKYSSKTNAMSDPFDEGER